MSKICPECKTENEDDYSYCQNCGTPLPVEPQVKASTEPAFNAQSQPTGNPDPADPAGAAFAGTQQNPYNGAYPPPFNPSPAGAIDGIPVEDLTCFIGKKAPKILPKFFNMEFKRSKISWCWPAAILGFLFGPFGSAFWFFYRKMYKIAWILVAIGVVFSFTTSALKAETNARMFESIFSFFGNGDFLNDPDSFTINDFLDAAEDEIDVTTTARDKIASGLTDIASLASCILTGLFGYYWYKKHCVKQIAAFRQGGIDMRYYQMGLASAGGTSGGMVVLGIVAMCISSYAASFICTLFAGLI